MALSYFSVNKKKLYWFNSPIYEIKFLKVPLLTEMTVVLTFSKGKFP